MIIHPDISVTPDRPRVQFREPREVFDLNKALKGVLHGQGWVCGTYFHVQYVNREKTTLYSSALFVVTEESDALVTSDDNPYSPMTKTIHTRQAEIVGEWWYSEMGKELRDAPKPEPEVLEPKLGYDNKAKLHQVRLGDEILFENAYKGKCQEFIREQRA